MEKIYRVACLLFLGLVFLSGCKKLLDTNIYGSIESDEFYKNRNDLNSAAIGMYGPLAKMPHQFLLWGSARADLVTYSSQDVFVNEFIGNNISASNPYLDYTNLYKSIARANRQMEKVYDVVRFASDVTNYDADAFYAEALAVRTLCYYYLVRTFQSFPLILTDPTEALITINGNDSARIDNPLETLTLEQIQAITNDLTNNFSREKVWKQIYSDAIKAYGLMPNGYKWTVTNYDADQNYVRMSKLAIGAMLAEIALWQGDFSTVSGINESYARLVSTAPGSKDTWMSQFTNSFSQGHTFFTLGYNFSKNRATNRLQEFTSPIEGDGGKYLLKPNMSSMDSLYKKDETIDLNGKMSIFPAKGDVRSGFTYKTLKNKEDAIWKYIGTSTDNASMRPPFQSTASWPMLKSANLLFAYALAKHKLGQGQWGGQNTFALTALNNIRDSRGRLKFSLESLGLDSRKLEDINTLDSLVDANLFNWIGDEMAREFAFEGQRWYQLMLLSKLTDINILAQSVSEKYPEEMQAEMFAYLSNENNWYLPQPQK